MEYQTGAAGRVFYARLDDGEDLHQCLTELVRREQVRYGTFQVFGGLKSAGVVTGPQEPVMPPEPVWRSVADAREILGIGSVFWEEDTPRIHLHAAMGHHGETLIGCLRKDSRVYLVIELLLMEVTGIEVTRPWWPSGGFNRPTFQKTEAGSRKQEAGSGKPEGRRYTVGWVRPQAETQRCVIVPGKRLRWVSLHSTHPTPTPTPKPLTP